MDLKYSQAIKAGIIGGVIVAMLILIRSGIDVIGSWTTSLIGIIGCCIWIIELVLLIATGALAVHFARAALKDMNDALVAGAVSGGVAGLIAAGTTVIVAFITPFVLGSTYTGDYTTAENLGIAGIASLFGGLGTACCCAPIWLIVSIIIGAIGGAIYYSVKK